MKVAGPLALFLLAPGLAAAAPPPSPVHVAKKSARPAPKHAVSLSVPALTVRSLAVSYEHQGLGMLLDDRFSLFTSAGLRGNTTGDYSSATVATSVGLRYWLTGGAPWSSFTDRAMVGAFAGFRLGLGYTNIRDDVDDERIGASFTLSETAELGYRFAPWGRVEITPSLGLQLRHEFDVANRLPAWTRLGASMGLSIGYLF